MKIDPENCIKMMHTEAVSLLEDVGVHCTDDRIIGAFEGTGLAAYDTTTNRIHILRDLTKACLETTAKRDKFPVPNHSFGGGGVAAYIKQGDDYIMPVTELHVADIMRTAEEFNVPFMFKAASRKFTFEEQDKQIPIMRKWYSGFIYARAESTGGIKACLDEYNDTGKIATTHSIMSSPLKFNETGNNIDTFFNCVEAGLPVYLTTMPVSCLTGPASMYGVALQGYAEYLAGMSLAQIKNPNLMTINGAYPTAGDPGNGYQPHIGCIFHNLANYMSARVSERWSLPSIQSGCTISTANHEPTEHGTDIETVAGYMIWHGLDGWHQLRHTHGFVDTLAAFDMNKMRRDLNTLERIVKNNDVMEARYNDVWYDSDAYEAIRQGASVGHYKELTHTTKMIGVIEDVAFNR